ncbi:MAG: hypothetical protein Q7J68_07380 [Thermoplasmata archaeon]|nr:hypothetical protein [Thermoplasmata archaeon]
MKINEPNNANVFFEDLYRDVFLKFIAYVIIEIMIIVPLSWLLLQQSSIPIIIFLIIVIGLLISIGIWWRLSWKVKTIRGRDAVEKECRKMIVRYIKEYKRLKTNKNWVSSGNACKLYLVAHDLTLEPESLNLISRAITQNKFEIFLIYTEDPKTTQDDEYDALLLDTFNKIQNKLKSDHNIFGNTRMLATPDQISIFYATNKGCEGMVVREQDFTYNFIEIIKTFMTPNIN